MLLDFHKDMTLSNANKLNEIKNNGSQNNNENKTSDNNNNSENKNNNIYSNYMVNNQINLNKKPTSTFDNEDGIKNINDTKPKSILKNCSNNKINKEKENKSISYGDNNLCEINEDDEDNNNDQDKHCFSSINNNIN